LGEVLLEVRDLTRQFGALRAVDGVTFALQRGEVLGIIGPNGSGKTTLFNCISGLLPPNAGSVRLRGAEVANRPMDEIARRGLVRTFQHPMMFPSQTVRQSVQLALDITTSYGRREIAPLAIPRDVDGLLVFCSLAEVADVPVRTLAYGHTRLLGVAMAMAASPHVVMLDEPAAGLNHLESARLADLLLRAREAGATLVVVDHDMAFLLPLCDRILVLDAGVRICEGTPQQVQTDPRVVEVYLGGGFAEGRKPPAAPVAEPPRAAASASVGLQLRDVTIGYGPIAAVHGLSLSVGAGEAVALLGANGAGKSTTLRALSGLLRPRSGQILWDGTDLVGRRPADILRLGIAHVPEGRQLFAQQTVAENLLLGQLVRKDRARALEDMDYLLGVFPALKPKLKQPAGQLSGGQQQMLAIARGLMSNPRLLLLDEPSLGLSPMLVDEVAELIARLRSERQMSLLLVEQNPFMAARLTERVYVLQTGRIRSELRSSDVMGNVALLDAYLGKAPADALV
jgi:ABC-type branched-subunit amino acid transport system ATPase component